MGQLQCELVGQLFGNCFDCVVDLFWYVYYCVVFYCVDVLVCYFGGGKLYEIGIVFILCCVLVILWNFDQVKFGYSVFMCIFVLWFFRVSDCDSLIRQVLDVVYSEWLVVFGMNLVSEVMLIIWL